MKKLSPDQVLTTVAAFRQRVNLPAAQVSGLSDAELASALAFEVEPFSGIPHAESRIAWKRVNAADAARAVFDVVQIRTRDLVEEVAKAKKAKRNVLAVTAPPESAAGETVEDLPWVPVKAGGGISLKLPLLGALAALLALLAMGWHGMSLRTERRRLEAEVAVQLRLQGEKNALESQLSALRRQIDGLRERRMEAERAQQNAEVLRSAWRVLLEAVPRACRDESVLKSVKATGAYSAQLTGLSLSTEAATRTFVRLSEELKPPKSGWRLSPGAVNSPAGGGTVTFECQLDFDPEGQFK